MHIRKLVIATALCLLSVPACADPISGYVKADGTPLITSSLYIVEHPTAGRYKIIFATPLEPLASCVISIVGARSTNIRLISETASSCTVKFHNDFDFSFIAVPMSN